MIKKCENCGKTFKAERETAKFCSDKCKKQSQRLAGQDTKTLAGHSPNSSGTTPSGTKGKLIANNGLEVREGFCHGCGKEVDKVICICSECFKKGITHKSLEIPMCRVKKEKDNFGLPNYQRMEMKDKLERSEVIPYILWCLKGSGATGNSSITVLGKTFNWGAKKVEAIKSQVKEFRVDMLK